MTRLLVQAVVCLLLIQPAWATAGALEQAIDRLDKALPRSAAGFAKTSVDDVRRLTANVEAETADLGAFPADATPAELLSIAERLVAAKRQVDSQLDRLLAIRTQMPRVAPFEQQRAAIRGYLQATGAVIDLSGRLRYLLVDKLRDIAIELAPRPERRRFVETLIAGRSASGAIVMSDLLFDPPPDVPRAQRPDSELRGRILALVQESASDELLPTLARFVKLPAADPRLVVQAAEAIRQIGLPQDARPQQDPILPRPAITAAELHRIVSAVSVSRRSSRSSADLAARRAELLAWLETRREHGLVGDTLRVEGHDVHPGDWLLMRNPSPYNLFTDLSPGLFTHVGVVTVENSSDGRRRMVVVDLPDRGNMPATNVDLFLKRTRHYVFVRHDDAEVAAKMGQVAASTIGSATQFDLNFRTARVFGLHGKALGKTKIHTYCAGLLLLCALESGGSRDELFPVAEYPAGGRTLENLAKLGMSIGEDFISPTGALFSSRLKVIARREPMYEPRREIEEAVYDHFADGMMHKTLVPSPDVYQSLRLKLAEASRANAVLAQALTAVVGVHGDTDLVAAAKASAVIETLDEVAVAASSEFLKAQTALRAGPGGAQARSHSQRAVAEMRNMRQLHARLREAWDRGDLTPRELRQELVRYYIRQGCKQLDDRFFASRIRRHVAKPQADTAASTPAGVFQLRP